MNRENPFTGAFSEEALSWTPVQRNLNGEEGAIEACLQSTNQKSREAAWRAIRLLGRLNSSSFTISSLGELGRSDQKGKSDQNAANWTRLYLHPTSPSPARAKPAALVREVTSIEVVAGRNRDQRRIQIDSEYYISTHTRAVCQALASYGDEEGEIKLALERLQDIVREADKRKPILRDLANQVVRFRGATLPIRERDFEEHHQKELKDRILRWIQGGSSISNWRRNVELTFPFEDTGRLGHVRVLWLDNQFEPHFLFCNERRSGGLSDHSPVDGRAFTIGDAWETWNNGYSSARNPPVVDICTGESGSSGQLYSSVNMDPVWDQYGEYFDYIDRTLHRARKVDNFEGIGIRFPVLSPEEMFVECRREKGTWKMLTPPGAKRDELSQIKRGIDQTFDQVTQIILLLRKMETLPKESPRQLASLAEIRHESVEPPLAGSSSLGRQSNRPEAKGGEAVT